MTRSSNRSRTFGLTLFALAASAGVALAGPPLLCRQFDIGTARSLPWDEAAGWPGRTSLVDMQTLVSETEALLTPQTPVIVRMETLRRAALYASRDERVAAQLFDRIQARARAAEQRGATDALATFDAGYLIETYRQIVEVASWGERDFAVNGRAIAGLIEHADGYALIQKSLAARGNDPAIEFAAALAAVTSKKRAATAAQHAQKARAGAAQDGLLARNLSQLSRI